MDANICSALFPRPQRVHFLGRHLRLAGQVRLILSAPTAIRSAATRLAATLDACGIACEWSAVAPKTPAPCEVIDRVRLELNATLLPKPESYRLAVESRGIHLIASDQAGLFYGVMTLSQLLVAVSPAEEGGLWLPEMIVTDWPDFAARGVMLDVSRDKVPKMETLYALVEQLASWKINQLQLYMEHTFAYDGHEQVWRDASPLTGEQILALDAFCRARHVELVPNQNSFGHMHRWLMHDAYRDLAECPEGIEHPFNRRVEPFGLCPIEPKSLELLRDLYSQLLPHFESRLFNVGLDETFDLGRGRSKEVCEARGTAAVYLDFLREIATLAKAHGRTIQFWADIVLKHPASITSIPGDAIGMIWGYEAEHPFAEQCEALASAGLQFYVCPGTSSWNSFAGRTTNAIGNLREAARSGREHGALGYLMTDWGDFGHMQPLPVSQLGFLAGAGFSWNGRALEGVERDDWCAWLNRYVLKDDTGRAGEVLYDLGDAYRVTGARSFNASPLFRLLVLADRHAPEDMEYISLESLARTRAYIEACVARLDGHQMACTDAELVEAELRWVADVLCFACDFATARLEAPGHQLTAIPASLRATLRKRLDALITQHRVQWLARNRPGGLEDSIQHLAFVKELLED